MFERLTDRARQVMALANQEAQRFNHEYIGTEHILLGLIKEGSGTGVGVLKILRVDLRRVRREVEKLVRAGPDMVAIGKLPVTPRSKKVIEYAIEEARRLKHEYVGSEHLLLGLLREADGIAGQVLDQHGVTIEAARREVTVVAPTADDDVPVPDQKDADLARLTHLWPTLPASVRLGIVAMAEATSGGASPGIA